MLAEGDKYNICMGYVDCGRAAQEAGAAGRFASDSERIRAEGWARMELLGKSLEELRAYCKSIGEPEYRGGQIFHALYAERKFNVAEMTNLPGALREKLPREASITLPEVRRRYISKDGSVRYLFGIGEERKSSNAENTEDAESAEKKEARKTLQKPAAVEAVFMPSEGRQTICISTQAGCAVDCQFCLTAQLGLIRNLTAGEIVGQVLVPLQEMGEAPEKNSGAPTGDGTNDAEADGLAGRTNVVLMGQGEPLLNFENVMAALRILLDEDGVGLSPKHVTLSTSGIVPGWSGWRTKRCGRS